LIYHTSVADTFFLNISLDKNGFPVFVVLQDSELQGTGDTFWSSLKRKTRSNETEKEDKIQGKIS
jgi:hypothetical protein